jgi:hypothetical protein
MPLPHGPVARALVLLTALALSALALAQDAPRPARRRATPIRDSLDRVIERVVLAHLEPCEAASRNGVPCFPVGIEQEGPRFSVAEALRRYRGTGSPAPGVPTVAEIQHQMSGAMQSASGGVSTDPVCAAKGLWRRIRGNATTYHLYRTWDERGERPLLADHLLDPEDYRANPGFRFEYLGRFDGECAAVAAWNAALRDAVASKPSGPEPPPREEPR